MEGTYATEPARPHYCCDCEISFVRNSDRENTDNNCRLAEEEISWEGAGAGEHAWDNNDPTFSGGVQIHGDLSQRQQLPAPTSK